MESEKKKREREREKVSYWSLSFRMMEERREEDVRLEGRSNMKREDKAIEGKEIEVEREERDG